MPEQVTGPDERIIYSVSKETEGKFTVRPRFLYVCRETSKHICECRLLVSDYESACGGGVRFACYVRVRGQNLLLSMWIPGLTWGIGTQFIASDTGLYRCCFGNFMSTVTVRQWAEIRTWIHALQRLCMVTPVYSPSQERRGSLHMFLFVIFFATQQSEYTALALGNMT